MIFYLNTPVTFGYFKPEEPCEEPRTVKEIIDDCFEAHYMEDYFHWCNTNIKWFNLSREVRYYISSKHAEREFAHVPVF